MNELTCPADHELVPLLAGELVDVDVQTHLESCTFCQTRLGLMRTDLAELRSFSVVPTESAPYQDGFAAALERPATIGKYLVVGALDTGGQACVYRAVHPTLDKELVIKLSRRPVSDNPNQRHLLVTEGKLLAGLEHPNLARIYDLDFHEDRPFLVMEYVRGPNLKRYAEEEKPPPRQAARLVAAAARALALVHKHGIIHQDIKPNNLLIDEAGRPRLIDFGIARLGHAWAGHQPSGGTPPFMAPEQARDGGTQVTPRSDLFALGGVLYFLLTGKAPFEGNDVAEVLDRAGRCDFDRAALRKTGVPRRLEAICLRAMAANPADRYERAEDFAADLERFLERPRVLARAGMLLAATLLLAVGVWALVKHWPTTPTPVETAADKPELQVRVSRGKEDYTDLSKALPLRTATDKLQIVTKIPRGATWMMFLVSQDGRVQRLEAEMSPGDTFDRLVYPRGGHVPFAAGSSGTEFLLVCAAPTNGATFEEVEKLLTQRGAWPTLPPRVAVWLTRQEYRRQTDAPPPSPRLEMPESDPVGQVEYRLDQLRLQLREKFGVLLGVAFAHQADPQK